MPDDDWMTRREVAAHFKIGLRTVGRWLGDGLPHTKFGDAPNAAVRIRRCDVDRWWKQHYKGWAS